MILFLRTKSKITVYLLLLCFIFSGINIAQAAVLPYMPDAGQIISTGTVYDLPCLIGLKFTSDNPFEFTFLVDKGSVPASRDILQAEIDRIGKYFLAALNFPRIKVLSLC